MIKNHNYEFYIRLAGRAESVFSRACKADMDEEQIRHECRAIMNTYQGDCPVGVDVYQNGKFLLNEDIDND